jgi:hypothetical protein
VSYRLLGKMLYDSAAIKHRVSTRIYFEYAPELKSIPVDQRGDCLILRKLSSTPETHLQNECDMAMPMYQIDSYSSSQTKAESLHELVRNRLSGFGPSLVEDVLDSEGIESDVWVSAIVLESDYGYIEQPRDASDKWTHRFVALYKVFHSQPVPTHA